MNQTRLCLLGPTGSGKSTIASYLQSCHNAEILKIAAPLYEAHDRILTLLHAERMEVDGKLIQALAERYMALSPDYLANTFERSLYASSSTLIVNDDCRANNYQRLRALGFVFVRVATEDAVRLDRCASRKIPLDDDHPTERGLNELPCEFTIDNSGHLNDSKRQINNILTRLGSRVSSSGWLTGEAIKECVADGRIQIEPFDPKLVNPNSYNYRLSSQLLRLTNSIVDTLAEDSYEEVHIPDSGYTLQPGECYLGCTRERFGSYFYASLVTGRSSIGRKFILNHQCAGLIDQGFFGQITLEITVHKPTVVYPGLLFGQIFWFSTLGVANYYAGKYQDQVGPQTSRLERD
jgi:dCTP deaminase